MYSFSFSGFLNMGRGYGLFSFLLRFSFSCTCGADKLLSGRIKLKYISFLSPVVRRVMFLYHLNFRIDTPLCLPLSRGDSGLSHLVHTIVTTSITLPWNPEMAAGMIQLHWKTLNVTGWER
ncbi:hypothetical protein BDZ91DRAFT_26888 [Kalaharituber pfeilii]|nr:hypothetical protein BDZ91DRAFT_26888 [Kalaharituber pfeilii]